MNSASRREAAQPQPAIRFWRMLSVIAAMSVPPVFVAACASDHDIDLATYVEQTDPPDLLYNQGLANLNSGRLKEAAAKFEAIDRQHPYSDYARKAKVMGAFTNYRRGNYDEAVSAGERFVALYPYDEDAAYAQYIVGLSYFRQIRDVTQDQKETIRAMNAMKELVERWPDSEYVDDAQTKIRFARDQLAGKEMQIGRYYQERHEYVAALTRFRNVVEVYSDTRHAEEALARLAETYYAMGMVSEAQTAAAVLGHNFPDSEWYQSSYRLLQSGGLQPREDKGSWLSRIASTITGA